MFKVGLIEV
ncbi:hypothetical protein VCHENC02_0271A, partial [Vibrio harveyi]